MFAVEVGARSTRKGARLHILGGCGWASTLPLVGKIVKLTAANAHRCCGNCRKAIRTAIDTARAANDKRCASNHTVKIEKIQTEGRLTALVELFRTATEIARHAELLSRPVAPVEVEAVPVLSKLGQVARNLGTPVRSKHKGRPASRRNANVHNLFVVKAA